MLSHLLPNLKVLAYYAIKKFATAAGSSSEDPDSERPWRFEIMVDVEDWIPNCCAPDHHHASIHFHSLEFP